ncbi:AadS family aminoglycoside 6-adenylyltransferase [Chitinophaga polysaccharea]|uniref:AadS family aminoglycoside 6-adenylyltransferase n=1 Tax=Chitinophaga TaxID=79328 RepID=UPI001455CDD5|nr:MULTISPECIES: AadS family aminoglycoside 6-adenylyltransferase [Chitinophaga]NLR58255.1 AadS family aminoglycoside 6-adenylyltransferase [Chitinophaga polysaccharea]NLU90781.1 AadS family aminoglycoside 6-adenylyltransferase [Chitinophaga sp. Ak27]
MTTRDQKLEEIIGWAKRNRDIRALLLTSSLANPSAPVDEFSDLDIELVFEDNAPYLADNSWLKIFGHPISMIEEDETCFDGRHGMKMVLYDDRVKVDFKLYSRHKFLEDAQAPVLPEDWDIGYQILLDKDQLTKDLKPPMYDVGRIQPPTEKEFTRIINDFWWDTTYVAKCLARDEIFYAKFMSETNIRTEYLVPLIEWYIGSEHQWRVTTNKYGRFFKKYLSPALWKKIEKTFSGSSIADNWEALFAMADIVHELGTALSRKLDYPYPEEMENNIRKYLEDSRSR